MIDIVKSRGSKHMGTSASRRKEVMQFKNSQVEYEWNTWVERYGNDTDPVERGAVKFGQRFVELAEAKLAAGSSLDCWKELVAQADEDILDGQVSVSGRVIEIVLSYIVQAWKHGDELELAMSR